MSEECHAADGYSGGSLPVPKRLEDEAKEKIWVDMTKVDWVMLRNQADRLSEVREVAGDREILDEERDAIDGILNLIAHCQSQAAVYLGEETVFGKETEEDKPINAP